MVGRNKAGKQFINVGDEAILPPAPFTPAETSIVAAASRQGRLLVFLLEEMKVLSGGGKGVIVMDLDKGDSLAGAIVTAQPAVTLELKGGRTLNVKDAALQDYFGKRARKGKLLGLKRKGEVSGFSAA